ncbi:hypothetical protein ACFYKX_07690 [Cytobacillus sp. FJAT-54145]|uniref:Uncharacterized protein n=1 Tax=Cytobacillus spartinae TaxID=3299023 RepID=A0ABW6KB75_9BACI
MKNNGVSDQKEMKRNSYESEKQTNGVTHLKHAPKPHGIDVKITEDVE